VVDLEEAQAVRFLVVLEHLGKETRVEVRELLDGTRAVAAVALVPWDQTRLRTQTVAQVGVVLRSPARSMERVAAVVLLLEARVVRPVERVLARVEIRDRAVHLERLTQAVAVAVVLLEQQGATAAAASSSSLGSLRHGSTSSRTASNTGRVLSFSGPTRRRS
jgi:hypothetical protein